MIIHVNPIGVDLMFSKINVIVLFLIRIWGNDFLESFAVEVSLPPFFFVELDVPFWIRLGPSNVIFVIGC